MKIFNLIKKQIVKILSHPLFKTSFLYTFTDAINKATPFFILPILTHYLSPSDYGVISNYNIYIYILTIFISLNLSGLLGANFYKMNKKELAELMCNILLIMLFSFLICTFFISLTYEFILSFLPIPLDYIFLGLFIALLQTISNINLALWQLEAKPLKFGFFQITQTLLNVGISLLLIILLNWGWRGRICAVFIAAFIYGLFSLFLVWRRGYLKLTIKRTYIEEVLKFGVPLLPHALSIWIRTGVDRILVTTYFGTAEAGLYSTGFQFGLLVSFLTMAFNNAYVPYLFKELSIEDSIALSLKKLKIVKFTYVYMLGLIIVCLVLFYVSIFIIEHFLGLQYNNAAIYVPWSMLSQMFQGMYLMFVCFVFYSKKTSGLGWITMGCSLLQIGLSFFLLKSLGPIGIAYSSVVISLLNFVVVWAYSHKVFEMPWFSVFHPREILIKRTAD